MNQNEKVATTRLDEELDAYMQEGERFETQEKKN